MNTLDLLVETDMTIANDIYDARDEAIWRFISYMEVAYKKGISANVAQDAKKNAWEWLSKFIDITAYIFTGRSKYTMYRYTEIYLNNVQLFRLIPILKPKAFIRIIKEELRKK